MVIKFMLLEDPSAVFWDVTLSLGQVILRLFAREDEGNSVLQNIWGHHPTTVAHHRRFESTDNRTSNCRVTNISEFRMHFMSTLLCLAVVFQ
jgi:hypothetical protein